MAERPRAELGRAVHPADDAAGGELVGDPLDQRRLVELFDRLAVLAPPRASSLRVDRRSPERMIGHVAIRVAANRRGRHRAPRRARSPHRRARTGRTRARSPTPRESARWRRR